MIVLCVCFLVFVYFVWSFLKKDKRHEYYGNLIPGAKPYPVIGNLLDLPKDFKEFLVFRGQLHEQYGDVVRFWGLQELNIWLRNPNDIELILKNPKEINKGRFHNFMKNWLGSGLITSSGHQWLLRRKALTPTFHFKILEQFVEVFNSETNQLIRNLKQKKLPGEVDMKTEVRNTFIDIICETAMGIKTETVSKDVEAYSDAADTLNNIITKRALRFLHHINFIWKFTKDWAVEAEALKVANGVIHKIIQEKEQEVSAERHSGTADDNDETNDLGIKKKTAFLEMVLKMKLDGNPAIKSNQDVVDETNTFFAAGHDTVSTATYFTLEMLARHPNIQENVYKELKDNIDDLDYLTTEVLQKLPYLDRVLKESLRLYPPAPIIEKQIINDVVLPGGYTLPGGCQVNISIFHVHRHPDHYEKPLEFNPDHFLPEIASKRHPYAFIPFSAGPRNCIGQKFALLQFKIMIAKLVYNFRISLPEGKKGDEVEQTLHATIVLKAEASPLFLLTVRN